MRDQPLGGQSPLDVIVRAPHAWTTDAMTGAAGQFGRRVTITRYCAGTDVQPLGSHRSQSKKDACTARAAGCSGHQGFDDARQMLGQLTTVGSALGSSLLAGSGIGATLGYFESRDGLFDILQNKL